MLLAEIGQRVFIVLILLSAACSRLYCGTCEQLTKLQLGTTHIIGAEMEAPGVFLPPDIKADAPEAGSYKKLPAFCRVVAEARPTNDSRIAIEVWMPVRGWNGKFRGQGNGGFAGAIDYRGMAGSVSLGYATAATDAGHKGEATDASWALGHPEKVIDFGYRAVHEMTESAKPVIRSFYGKAAERSYFDACSDGGREALMEAQRFPQDYDGILAGAPANNWTRMLAAGLQVEQTGLKSRANWIPPDKLPIITERVLATCDAGDRVRDGILNDPPRCHFNPSSLLCAHDTTQSCLTAPQVETLEKVYAGGVDTRGKQIFPGLMPSSEAGDNGWKNWVTGEAYGAAEGTKYANGFFKYMVFEDAHWSFRGADAGVALQAAERKLASVLNSTDPDLSKFNARGGKLIIYHGWLDPAISPLNAINYYQSVVSTMGPRETNSFLRLYLVPGMQHCAGGPGPFMFGQLGIATARDADHDIFTALEGWVEDKRTPGEVIATKLEDDHDPSKGIRMTRPLCPYPQLANYLGKGDPSKASSFICGPAQD